MAYKTIYPFTNETLKEYANHTDAELEQAIASGHALYKKWRRENNLEERKAQLHKVADLLRRDADKYAETITKDMGKLIGEAKGEVLLAAGTGNSSWRSLLYQAVYRCNFCSRTMEFPILSGYACICSKLYRRESNDS